MGLRLRKHSSPFPSQLPGPAPARASDSETEIYTVSTPEPFPYDYQDPNRPPLRTAQQDSLDGRQRKRRRLLTLCTRDDAAEGGYASLVLSDNNSDDNTFSISFSEPQWCTRSSRRRRRSSTSLSPRRVSRPPSLERQDAFRDERTAKSRHAHHHHHHGYSYDELVIAGSYLLLSGQSEMAERPGSEVGDEEGAREIADLCRMGLLRYANDCELDRIVRRDVAEGPAKWARREDSGFVSLCSVDLAVEALAEHKALAGWLMPAAIIDGCNGANERALTEEGGVDPLGCAGS